MSQRSMGIRKRKNRYGRRADGKDRGALLPRVEAVGNRRQIVHYRLRLFEDGSVYGRGAGGQARPAFRCGGLRCRRIRQREVRNQAHGRFYGFRGGYSAPVKGGRKPHHRSRARRRPREYPEREAEQKGYVLRLLLHPLDGNLADGLAGKDPARVHKVGKVLPSARF